MSLLHLLSYVGIVAAGAFVVLSLASGLLWISELIEEHSRMAKIVGIRAVYAIILLHILLYFTDSLPLLHVLLSVLAHVVYLQNFSHTWPFISLTSPVFLSSCVLAISNHFAWFFYFSSVSREARAHAQRGYHGRGSYTQPRVNENALTAPAFADIATFFALCVWFIPLFLFLSLSANDNALPVVANGFDSPTRMTHAISQAGRSSLFKSILDFFPFLPRRRDRSEGILVTHTPVPSAPSTPRTSYSGGRPNPYSAGSRSSFDIAYPPSPSLRPPPKRASTGPVLSTPVASSPRVATSEDEVVMSARSSSSLIVSKSVSEESPIRRRTVAE